MPVFCRYVTYNAWLPRHALSAVRILLAVTMYPTSHSQLISAFTSSPVHRMEIRHGFVECLEADDDEVVSVSCDLNLKDWLVSFISFL
jgi:nuclear pore complex protein Nup205